MLLVDDNYVLVDMNTDDRRINSTTMAIPSSQEETQLIMNLILENGEFYSSTGTSVYSWRDLDFAIPKESFVSFEEEEIFKDLFLDSSNPPIFYSDVNRLAYVTSQKNLLSLACIVYFCLSGEEYTISLKKHLAARKVWDWLFSGLTYHPGHFVPNAFKENVRKLEELMDTAE